MILAALALAGCGSTATPTLPVIYPFSAGVTVADQPLVHGSDEEVALATRLRPHLYFDTTERWKPLEIGAFLDERFSDGTGNHLWSSHDYLEIHGSGRNGIDYFSPAAGRCMDADQARHAKSPPDCDRGARSAIYYRRTTHDGLWYWDYWTFYRYNDYTGLHNHCWFVCDDHEGDWEGVTIVTTRDVLAPRIVGAIYAEHTDRIAVAGSALSTDAGHAHVYVAAGTHASYRYRCPKDCDQHVGSRFEEPHDGSRPWAANDDGVCERTRCVRSLPELTAATDEADPRPAGWNAWTATWGSTCRPRCATRLYSGPSPQAPGQQTRYRCPWLATRVDQGRVPVLGLATSLPAKAIAAGILNEICRAAAPAPELTEPALVALGDSYSAGVGTRNYDRESGGCLRSAGSWPLLAAKDLQVQGRSVACNGAEIPGATAQIARIGARPDILTLTIGGNDAGFAGVLADCVISDDCTDDGALDTKIRGLEPRLERLYRAIQAAVPGTRVVVVGYPRIFPRAVPRSSTPNCAAWDRFSAEEVKWINARGHTLDKTIERAAEAAGIEYVDVENAFDGHELRCGSGSYVNPLRLRMGLPPYEVESFHPDTAGQRRLADVVVERLRR